MKTYYVAFAGEIEFFSPVIIEKFNSKDDADSYAALMSKVKQRRYIILEQVGECNGAKLQQENQQEE